MNAVRIDDLIMPAARGHRQALLRRCIPVLLSLVCLYPALSARADTVEVTISGIEGKLLTNVRRSLSIAQEHEQPWSERRIRQLYQVGRTEARRALAPYGYYNPHVAATLKPPTEGGSVWQATYRIEPGPPTKVETLTLDVVGPGAGLPTFAGVLDGTELHQGDVLHHADYKAAKKALSEAAYAAGFLDAQFRQSVIRVDPRTNAARIALVMDTGERYHFGRVEIEQDFLAPAFVQKFVPIQPGDPFNADRLLDLQLILSDTDYFSQVLIDARGEQAYRAAAPGAGKGQLRVPVTVDVKPSKGQHYRFSLGYGTDTGPRAGASVKFRHINEYGHQFRLDLRVSAIERTLQASYDIPIENVIQDRLSFVGTLSNQAFGDVTSNFARLGVVRDTGWALGRHRVYLKLQYEHYDLDDGAGARNSFLLYPGYTWTLRQIDDVLETRKGYALRFDIRGSSEALGSSVDFLRAELSGGLIWPLTERSRLLLRGAIGAIAVDDFAHLPPSQRFFAGGGTSVRGYGYQELSPVTRGDTNVGGRYLAVGSIEADYRVYKDFYLAAFFDIGNAANQIDMDFKRSVGIGFRWASPVGMVRLDLAHPLDDPDTAIRIHFSLGPAL